MARFNKVYAGQVTEPLPQVVERLAAVAINPAVLASVPFDASRELVPVSLAVSQPMVMVVRS